MSLSASVTTTLALKLTLHSVPGAGIEPAQPYDYRFLRPTRLPIPPPGQIPIAIDLKPLHLPPDSYRDPPHGYRIAKVMKIGELLNKYF